MNHTGTVELRTERLLLRRFTMMDVDSVYENYGCDPLVNRYISFAPCAEIESARRFINMHIEKYDSDPAFYGWAVTLNNEVIGSIGLFNVDDDVNQCELGYSIGSKWWRKGYASEAADAVIDYAFDTLEFHRIYASHHIENIASEHVLEKIGMSYEGTLRDGQRNADGTYADLKLYAILQQDKRLKD
ncbi:MAG: GNAT family N-acetyltransferase [Eubacteriales bacterium]|nr:GNAT family N-acetyltransferase [Eubacteriales bacterium]